MLVFTIDKSGLYASGIESTREVLDIASENEKIIHCFQFINCNIYQCHRIDYKVQNYSLKLRKVPDCKDILIGEPATGQTVNLLQTISVKD